MVRKAMIIGLDSIVPDLIVRLAKEGTLPVMKKLMEKGVFGEGFATHPTLTGSNWTSIVSGTWPGTHGATCMWTHFRGEPLNRVRSSFLSTTSFCERLWETGERMGRKSILMKYPCTVPPTIKNSIQVEGSGAPWYASDPFEISPSMCYSNQPYPMAQYVQLRKATGWKNLPKSHSEPLEGTIEVKSRSTSSKRVYNVLFVDSRAVGYDRVIVSSSRNASEAVASLLVGEWSDWLREDFEAKIPLYPKFREDDRIVYEDTPVKRYTGTFRFRLVGLSADAGNFKLYQSQIFPTSGFTWPESIAKELVDSVGPFQEFIGPKPLFSNWIDDETFLGELEYQAWWLGKASDYLMSHHQWDLYFLQWHGPNVAQHAFWGGIDPISPWYNESYASRYWAYFKRLYGAADRMIGDIVKHADEETLIIVIADHGHIPYVYGTAMIGNALIKAGLLTYRRDREGRTVVDWSRTRAFPINSVHIYVNLKGRDPDGIVEPAKEYNDVCDKIVSAMYGIRDASGKCPIAFALRKDEAETIGLFGDRVGDIVYGMAAGYTACLDPTEDLEDFRFMKGAISVTDDAGIGQRDGPLPPNTSMHGSSVPSSRLGLGSIRVPLIMCGPDVKKGYVMRSHFRLIDIAPTVSHILDMPHPAQCEGSIILEALT